MSAHSCSHCHYISIQDWWIQENLLISSCPYICCAVPKEDKGMNSDQGCASKLGPCLCTHIVEGLAQGETQSQPISSIPPLATEWKACCTYVTNSGGFLHWVAQYGMEPKPCPPPPSHLHNIKSGLCVALCLTLGSGRIYPAQWNKKTPLSVTASSTACSKMEI